jgi:TRAP-type C4-dicarboxylate transport system permease small subunit
MSLRSAQDPTNAAANPATGEPEYQSDAIVAGIARAMVWVNRAVMVICTLALLAAAGVLTYSVIARYFLKISTDWQDEAAVFLLVGGVFLAGAYVQSFRGHIGIEALAGILPARVNHVRRLAVDLASLVFCAFFTWKSWTLLIEAVRDDYTTGSSWGPPLWIPYSTMAIGMTLLCLQILLQLADRLLARKVAA